MKSKRKKKKRQRVGINQIRTHPLLFSMHQSKETSSTSMTP